MSRFYYTVFLIVIAIHHTLAQNDFRPGRVFTNNGDTLNGTINFNNRSSTYVQLKLDNSKDLKTFGVNDLKGYEVEGQLYLRKNVALDGSNYNYLLRSVILGRASLFYLKTPSNYEYYFLEKNDSIYFLKGGKKTINRTDGTFDMTIREYWGILRIHTADCEKLNKNFPDFAFREEEMAKIVKTYNECFESVSQKVPEENKNSTKVKSRIIKGMRLGVNYPIISTYGNRSYFNPSPTPIIGAFVDIPFSGSNKNLSSFIELAYSPKSSTATGEGKSLGYSDFRINFWDINTIIRYSLARGTVRPMVGAGVFGSISGAEIVLGKGFAIDQFLLGYQGEAGINIPLQSRNLFLTSRLQKIAGNKSLRFWTYSISVGFGF